MIRRYLQASATALVLVVSFNCWAALTASDFFKSGAQLSFVLAAADGRTDEPERLVADGRNVNALGAEDMTALWWAMLHSSEERGFLAAGSQERTQTSPLPVTEQFSLAEPPRLPWQRCWRIRGL